MALNSFCDQTQTWLEEFADMPWKKIHVFSRSLDQIKRYCYKIVEECPILLIITFNIGLKLRNERKLKLSSHFHPKACIRFCLSAFFWLGITVYNENSYLVI